MKYDPFSNNIHKSSILNSLRILFKRCTKEALDTRSSFEEWSRKYTWLPLLITKVVPRTVLTYLRSCRSDKHGGVSSKCDAILAIIVLSQIS